MKSKKPLFTIKTDNTGGYTVLYVGAYAPSEYSCQQTRALKLRFQQTNSEPGKWYGSTIEIERDSLDDIWESTKLLRKLFPKLDKFREPSLNGQVETVLQRLKAVAVEVVSDNRVGDFVPIDQVLPADWHSWRDDWDVYSKEDGCTVGALARDEAEARQRLTQEFAALTHRAEQFDRWLAAGRPVKRLDSCHYGMPKFTTSDLILESIAKAKQAEAA